MRKEEVKISDSPRVINVSIVYLLYFFRQAKTTLRKLNRRDLSDKALTA